MHEEIESERAERKQLQAAMGEVEKSLSKMSVDREQAHSQGDNELKTKVAEIAKVVEEMKAKPPSRSTNCIAIIGGLDGLASLEESEKWLMTELASSKALVPLDVFIKGDTFKGIVFAKFASPTDMETALAVLEKKRLQCKGKRVWANEEKPVEVRKPRDFLFSFKKLLISWNFSKQSVKVDKEELSMSVEGTPVLQVTGAEGELKMQWLVDEWEKWEALHSSTEFKEMKAACSAALANAKERQSKGSGKGQ